MPDDLVQQRITGFWSAISSEYESHEGNVPARDSAEYHAWVDALRELLPPATGDVLDIATGTGFVALIAARLGHRVTGIDASEAMLELARAEAARRGLNATFAAADAVDPGLPAVSFDAIISRHFIWTLREPERAFANWRMMLRPGGCVVTIDGFWFTEPEPEGAEQRDSTNIFDRAYTAETRAALPAMRLTSVEPVVAMFERAGFAIDRVSDLARVHALAEHPPGSEPWYVIVARRPA